MSDFFNANGIIGGAAILSRAVDENIFKLRSSYYVQNVSPMDTCGSGKEATVSPLDTRGGWKEATVSPLDTC